MNQFEGVYNPPPAHRDEPAEKHEAEVLEALIEASLEQSIKCNEGKNALIMRFDLAAFGRDAQEMLMGQEVDSEHLPQLASKVLKIYVPGEAEKEAERQAKAQEILAQADQEAMAQVPRVYVSRDLEIKNEALMERMRGEGFRSTENKISLIVMDYIDGPDLAAYIFEKVIGVHPGLRDLKQRIAEGENINEEEMSRRVGLALGFEAPAPSFAGDDIAKNIITNGRNGAKLSNYLKDNDVILEKTIFEKIQNALHILHEQNFYHNDLHERNVMLQKDQEGNVQDVFLIDFQTATFHGPDTNMEGDDLDLIRKYRPLTKSKDERQVEENTKYLAQFDFARWNNTLERNVAKKQIWEKMLADAHSIVSAQADNQLDHLFSLLRKDCTIIAGDNSWQDLAATVVLEVYRDKPEELKKFIDLARQKSSVIYLSNFWTKLSQKI